MKRSRRTGVLSPPPKNHQDFWATVHVRLSEAICIEDEEEPESLVGYYRSFGLCSESDRVPALIEESVPDGAVLWAETDWHPVDISTLDEAVCSRIQPVAGECVWYSSGRAFYPAQPDEPRGRLH